MNSYLIYAVGFASQILFAARLMVQWVKSEKAGRVLSPTLFWQLSLMASLLMMVYGVLREDFVILLGQGLSYFVYLRNLQFKKALTLIPFYIKIILILFPLLAALFLSLSSTHNLLQILENPDISLQLLIWGSLGQVIFAFRFVYQWYYSERAKKSIMPLGFWTISAIGSLIIISYAWFRLDPILFMGQIFGIIIYSRNIFIHNKSHALNAAKSNQAPNRSFS